MYVDVIYMRIRLCTNGVNNCLRPCLCTNGSDRLCTNAGTRLCTNTDTFVHKQSSVCAQTPSEFSQPLTLRSCSFFEALKSAHLFVYKHATRLCTNAPHVCAQTPDGVCAQTLSHIAPVCTQTSSHIAFIYIQFYFHHALPHSPIALTLSPRSSTFCRDERSTLSGL